MFALPNFSCSLILPGNGLPLSSLCGNPTDFLRPMSKPTSPWNMSQFASIMQSEAPFPSWFCSAYFCIFPVTSHILPWVKVSSILVCVCVCVYTQSCPTLCDSMHCSPPGSSVHVIFQERILKWVAISSSRGSSYPREWTHVSCISRWILYHWATWEASVQHLLFPYFRCVVFSI